MRNHKIYFEDIRGSIRKIEKYTRRTSFRDFKSNDLLIDAVIRNLEIIGEATKNLPIEIKKTYPDVEWKKIAGLRDILIHEYFGIDLDILWDIVKTKIPDLRKKLSKRMGKD